MNLFKEWWDEITGPLDDDQTDTLPMLLDLLARTGIVAMAIATPVVVVIGLLAGFGVLPR